MGFCQTVSNVRLSRICPEELPVEHVFGAETALVGGNVESSAKHVAVVGGGAAGLAAAVVAARVGARVTVIEAQDRVGNSIKVTGDGRCNIANAKTCASA